MKVPVPLPSMVIVDKATVGPVDVLQTTPLEITVAAALLTVPPALAELPVMEEGVVVVTDARVVKLTWLP